MFNKFKKWWKGDEFKKIHTAGTITVVVPNREQPFTMTNDHRLFPQLEKAVTERDMEGVLDVIAIVERVSVHTEGKVKIENGVVYFNDMPCHNIVAKRILQFMAEGIPAHYLIKFLERVMQNPLDSAKNELFLFLENGDLPIMDDGRFMAYKWVDENLLDCHTGTFDNSPGLIVSMPRENCDTDRNQTCSAGLHVCTQYYYSKFGARLLLVAVAPEDVVAVPIDYNNAKMRTWQYEVLEEIDANAYGTIKERAFMQYRKHVPVQEPVVDKPADPVKVPSKPPKKKGKQMTDEQWTKFKKAIKAKKSTANFGLNAEDLKRFREQAKKELANEQG